MAQRRKRSAEGRARNEKLLVRGLMVSLVKNGVVITSLAKAKKTSSQVERAMTIARQNTAASKQRLESLFGDGKIGGTLAKVFKERFEGKTSGFTRIIKLGTRRGDGSLLVRLEWSSPVKEQKEAKIKEV